MLKYNLSQQQHLNKGLMGILESACLSSCPSVYEMQVILCRELVQFCFNFIETLHICWSYIEVFKMQFSSVNSWLRNYLPLTLDSFWNYLFLSKCWWGIKSHSVTALVSVGEDLSLPVSGGTRSDCTECEVRSWSVLFAKAESTLQIGLYWSYCHFSIVGHIIAVSVSMHVFSGFFTPVLRQLSFRATDRVSHMR